MAIDIIGGGANAWRSTAGAPGATSGVGSTDGPRPAGSGASGTPPAAALAPASPSLSPKTVMAALEAAKAESETRRTERRQKEEAPAADAAQPAGSGLGVAPSGKGERPEALDGPGAPSVARRPVERRDDGFDSLFAERAPDDTGRSGRAGEDGHESRRARLKAREKDRRWRDQQQDLARPAPGRRYGWSPSLEPLGDRLDVKS